MPDGPTDRPQDKRVRPTGRRADDERSERLLRQEALHAVTERLARLGSWEWDVDADRVFWTDELYRIYGLAPQSRPIDFQTYLDLVHPDDRELAAALALRARAEGTPYDFQHRIVRVDDGAERIVRGRGEVVRDGAGRVVRLLGTSQDISDLVASEAAARRLVEEQAARRAAEAAHERLVSTLDSIGELFIATDHEWRVTFMNATADTYLRQLGLTRAAVVGKPIWQALPGLGRTRFHTQAMRAAAERQVVELEEYYPALGRWFVARIAPTPDGYASYTRDITERKEAEAAARKSHELLRAVVDATTDSIYVKDLEGRYVLANPALAKSIGRAAADIVGRTDPELFSPEAAETFRANDARVVAAGATRTFEEPGAKAGRVTLSTKGPLLDPSGKVAGLVGISRDITKRKRAEEAVRVSESRFRTLVQSMDDIVFELDTDGRIHALFGRWLEREGVDPRTMLGQTVRELLGPAAVAAHEPAFRRALGGEPAAYEWMVETLEGPRAMQVSLSPLRSGRRTVTGVVGVGRDITARARAERRQRFMAEAGALLSASLDYESTLASVAQLAVGVLCDLCVVDLLDDSGAVRRVAAVHRDPAMQPVAERLRRFPPRRGAGATARRVIETGRTIVVPEIDEPRIRGMAVDEEHLGLLRLLGVRSSMVVPLVARGRTLGSMSLVSTVAPRAYAPEDVALAEELGARAALAVDNARLYRDMQLELRQRQQAEAELRRWAHIFEHAGWGVLIVSADAQLIEAANPAVAQMHGCAVQDLVGRTVDEVLAPETAAAFADHLAAARGAGRVGFEAWHRRADGSLFPTRVDLTALHDATSGLDYFAMNVQDLTAQKRADEQVRQAQKMEALGRLAGGVAHDFNNMLMIILGFSDFLLASLAREDQQWADADEIRKAAERASALTRQLLTFGHRQVLETQPLDLNGILREMERMLRPLLGERVQLVTSLSAALGRLRADRGQLEQVVMNLCLNARDAMPEGGRLTLETMNVSFPEGYALRTVGIDMPAGDYVLLAVSDTGVGMDAETRSRIFEPFFTTKPASTNSGLGLATVYGIVTQFGGYLWVDSEPGQGSTFKLCFPRVTADRAESESAAPAAPRGGTETVLVVEDEESVRTLAARVLAEQGYRVLQAGHGREALEVLAAATEPVALVLTDVVMPEMDGRALATVLEQDRPDVRILYMSGYTENEILRAGLDRGGTLFLQKPFSPDSLVRKVREVLDAPLSAESSR